MGKRNKQKKKKKKVDTQVATPAVSKKKGEPKLKQASEVINRFRWDVTSWPADEVEVAYKDAKKGTAFFPLDKWRTINEGGDVPEHAISFFRHGAEILWSKDQRYDIIFHSGATNQTLSKNPMEKLLWDEEEEKIMSELQIQMRTSEREKAKLHTDDFVQIRGVPGKLERFINKTKKWRIQCRDGIVRKATENEITKIEPWNELITFEISDDVTLFGQRKIFGTIIGFDKKLNCYQIQIEGSEDKIIEAKKMELKKIKNKKKANPTKRNKSIHVDDYKKEVQKLEQEFKQKKAASDLYMRAKRYTGIFQDRVDKRRGNKEAIKHKSLSQSLSFSGVIDLFSPAEKPIPISQTHTQQNTQPVQTPEKLQQQNFSQKSFEGVAALFSDQ